MKLDSESDHRLQELLSGEQGLDVGLGGLGFQIREEPENYTVCQVENRLLFI